MERFPIEPEELMAEEYGQVEAYYLEPQEFEPVFEKKGHKKHHDGGGHKKAAKVPAAALVGETPIDQEYDGFLGPEDIDRDWNRLERERLNSPPFRIGYSESQYYR
jgi:hypothetical protein